MSYESGRRYTGRGISVIICLAGPLLSTLIAQTEAGWPFAGGNIQNSRSAASESTLSISNVGNLVPQWVYIASNDVSATPSMDPDSNAVYFPDWSGNIIKLNAANGSVIWRHNVIEYGLPKGAISRNTPALCGGLVIFGASGALGKGVSSPAYLNAVDPNTGNLVWQLEVDSNINALMTGSPVVYNNVIYVGVSSSEEKLSNPVFRGSVIAVSLTNGQLLWQTYMTPTGYSGVPIWSSTPAIDVNRNQLYVTTGNNYVVPVSVQQCEQAATGNAAKILACQSKANLADSIVALDLTTGAVKWTRHSSAEDNFISACNHGSPSCPDPRGSDWDFGSGANLFTANINGTPTDLVGAGQKSGVYWAVNPDNGNVVWKTLVGPGGILGGIQWGTAADGQRVYVAVSNSSHATYKLQPSEMSWNGGSWAALDAATGAFIWQVPDPGLDPLNPALPADSLAPVTEANGVVYVASMSGAMHALNASSGATLWSFMAQGSVNAGPSIFNGVLYWGSGYSYFPVVNPIGTASNQFYSFALPSNQPGTPANH